MSEFPYDSIPAGRDITRYIRDRIAGLPDTTRDWAPDIPEAFYHVTIAGKDQRIFFPYMPAESDVKQLLINVFAGPKTARFGWQLFIAYKSSARLSDCTACEYDP